MPNWMILYTRQASKSKNSVFSPFLIKSERFYLMKQFAKHFLKQFQALKHMEGVCFFIFFAI